jgi:hypothetical protein
MNVDYRIGDLITFSAIYAGKASRRFREMPISGFRPNWQLTALDRPLAGTATVTGISRRVMSGFWREGHKHDEEMPVTAGGDRELVLLVRTKPGAAERVVRIADATLISRHPDLIAVCDKLLMEKDHALDCPQSPYQCSPEPNKIPCNCWKADLSGVITRISNGQLGLFR